MHSLKELISGECHFDHYRTGNMWYNIEIAGNIKYIFPIDISDGVEVAGATFNSKEKSIYFMRYIRKAIDNQTLRAI